MADGYLRIGEFSERVGISPDLLRAWERRYGLLQPDRSSGGFRLYSDDDVARVEQVRRLTEQGLSVAEAARLVLERTVPATQLPPSAGSPTRAPSDVDAASGDAAADRLAAALESYDEAAAHHALDELLRLFSIESVLRDIVTPQMARIGSRWASGETSVAQEHFASNLLRGRLLAIARGWGFGNGPTAVLAAPPDEEHDLALITFGIALWRQGWRVTYLGADTPVASLRDAVDAVSPELIVLATVDGDRLHAVADELTRLSRDVPLAIAGAGASDDLATTIGARHLATDPVTAARSVASGGAVQPTGPS